MTDLAETGMCYRCNAQPRAASQSYCLPCKAKVVDEWRDSMTLQPTPEFPGVDIDRIHRVWRK